MKECGTHTLDFQRWPAGALEALSIERIEKANRLQMQVTGPFLARAERLGVGMPPIQSAEVSGRFCIRTAQLKVPTLRKRKLSYPTPTNDRITFNPDQCGGRPCIRGMRIRVKDVLDLLAAKASEEEILADYPYLEPDDIAACLEYAAAEADHPVLVTQ